MSGRDSPGRPHAAGEGARARQEALQARMRASWASPATPVAGEGAGGGQGFAVSARDYIRGVCPV